MVFGKTYSRSTPTNFYFDKLKISFPIPQNEIQQILLVGQYTRYQIFLQFDMTVGIELLILYFDFQMRDT